MQANTRPGAVVPLTRPDTYHWRGAYRKKKLSLARDSAVTACCLGLIALALRGLGYL